MADSSHVAVPFKRVRAPTPDSMLADTWRRSRMHRSEANHWPLIDHLAGAPKAGLKTSATPRVKLTQVLVIDDVMADPADFSEPIITS